MRTIHFSITPEVFVAFPDYRRAIVVASGGDNTTPAPTLGTQIQELVTALHTSGNGDDPRIVAWREAFGTLGMKVRDHRPSIDALVRRIMSGKPLGSISPLVDIGTIVSIKYLLPAGAHPILPDTTDVALAVTKGTEYEVLPDGTQEVIPVGEYVLLDSGRIATRRWVWRQTHASRILPETKDFFLNIDALPVIGDGEFQKSVSEAEALITSTFGIKTQTIILDAANARTVVEIP